MMEKTVTITKDQLIASLAFSSRIATNGLQEILLELAKEIAPKLKDDMEAKVILTQHEVTKYRDDGDE